MTEAKKSFRETKFYPILFMIVLSVIFIAILATFYHATAERVANYAETQLKKQVLLAFQLPADDAEAAFQAHVQQMERDGIKFYVAQKSGEKIGYCFPISGAGLWGKIEALIAVSPDFRSVLGFEILQQNETPGLGGRITERWFRQQFSGKVLLNQGKIQQFDLVPEGEPISETRVNQISGATSSSKAVISMIHQELQKIYETWEAQ